MIKTTFKILLALAAILATMYGEYYFPALGIVAGVLGLAFIYMLKEDVGWLPIITGSLMYFSTFIYIGIGARIIHQNDSIKVVSAFYPIGPSLGTGIRLDTLRLASCIEEEYYEKFKIRSSDMFVLTAADSTQILFSELSVVLRGKNLQFVSHETPWGKIDVCRFIDEEGIQHVYDLWGHDIHSTDYSLPIIEYKPEYYYTD